MEFFCLCRTAGSDFDTAGVVAVDSDSFPLGET